MILLSDIFDDLTYGELSNIKVGKDTLGSIAEKDYPLIISHINRGLVDLYQKFKIKTKELRLHQIAGTTKYYIRKDYMDVVSACGANDIYIEQAANDPFNDDLVKVLEVYDANEDEVPINNKAKTEMRRLQGVETTLGVFTPEIDVLTMEVPTTPEILTIVYQAYFPKIVLKEIFDPKKVRLYFPQALVKPLLLFIAARVVSGMKVSLSEGEANPATSRWSAYNYACKELENLNLVAGEDTSDEHFDNSGMP